MASIQKVGASLLALSSLANASPFFDKRNAWPMDNSLEKRQTCFIAKRDAPQGYGGKPTTPVTEYPLGRLSTPYFPPYLSNSSTAGYNSPPWGSRTVWNTNPYDLNNVPDTGVTRYYNFEISNQTITPGGVAVPGLIINGQFPAPVIVANWGDWIEVNVTNNIGDEGLAIHWHGLPQKETPWEDGVPGISQCPITPNGPRNSFVYRFRASLYGTTWYHSHYSAQYTSGIAGPMIIYGPSNVEYDHDIGPIMATDWYPAPYQVQVEYILGQNESNYTNPAPDPPNPPGVEEGALDPRVQNNLIDGRNFHPCNASTCEPDASISKYRFHAGKRHKLRLINHGAEAGQKFTFDNHNFTIVSNDMVPIKPFTVSTITLSVGQRADIIVNGTGKPTDSFYLRVAACSTNEGDSYQAVAAFYYEHADTRKLPTTTNPVGESCGIPPLLSGTGPPEYVIDPGEPATTFIVNVTSESNGTNLVWKMNNSTYRTDYNLPPLLGAAIGDNRFMPEWNIYETGSNSSVRIIWYNYAGGEPHPMHLHGHNVFQLASGSGLWNGSVQFGTDNQIRRDVVLLDFSREAGVPGYLVTQHFQDNPGIWPFHCHIAWHLSSGFNINLFEQPNELLNYDFPRADLTQTCCDWIGYTNTTAPDQIDAGIKGKF